MNFRVGGGKRTHLLLGGGSDVEGSHDGTEVLGVLDGGQTRHARTQHQHLPGRRGRTGGQSGIHTHRAGRACTEASARGGQWCSEQQQSLHGLLVGPYKHRVRTRIRVVVVAVVVVSSTNRCTACLGGGHASGRGDLPGEEALEVRRRLTVTPPTWPTTPSAHHHPPPSAYHPNRDTCKA